MDVDRLDRELERAYGGTPGERRTVARQARDLAESGAIERDRGHPLTVDEILRHLADAPPDTSLAGRWNWWMGALEVAYGGYEAFQVRRYPRE